MLEMSAYSDDTGDDDANTHRWRNSQQRSAQTMTSLATLDVNIK